MIDTNRNPGKWSDEALDVFWRTYVDILDYCHWDTFHHPLFYSNCQEADRDKLNDTIAWNAAWIAANNVDGL